MTHLLYDKYASSHVFASHEQGALLRWKREYFCANYARLMPADRGARIAEIGCGFGIHLKILAEAGYSNVCGVDVSPEQVAFAREKLGLVNVELADASDWLLDKNSTFDCVLSFDVFEHLPLDDLMIMGERIRNALRPGGQLIVHVPNGTAPLNPIVHGDLTHVRAFTALSLQQFFLSVELEPVAFYEVPRFVTDIKSAIQRASWVLFFRPAIGICSRLLYGHEGPGPVYTANILAVARRAK